MKKNKLSALLLLATSITVAVYALSQRFDYKETTSSTHYQAESYSGFDMFSKYNLY